MDPVGMSSWNLAKVFFLIVPLDPKNNEKM